MGTFGGACGGNIFVGEWRRLRLWGPKRGPKDRNIVPENDVRERSDDDDERRRVVMMQCCRGVYMREYIDNVSGNLYDIQ